jgi:hypothetical protein
MKRTKLHWVLVTYTTLLLKTICQDQEMTAYEKRSKVVFCFFIIFPFASEKPVWQFINQSVSHRHKIKSKSTGWFVDHGGRT